MHSVLMVVFDGLQPAQVNPGLMPNLSAYAARGVTFSRHHPVYPTVTRANAASMVTGRVPGGHGLAANTLMIRDFDPCRTIPALEPQLAQVKQQTGQVLIAPTLADILARYGEEYIAIGVGTSGNAYVHNPNADQSGGATIHPDFTLPGSLNQEIIARFGPWPAESRPNTSRMAHAVRIMTEYILAERQPRVALIWSSEPDKSQHDAGVGSELSNQAVKEADAQFGSLMRWLDATGRAGDTDVMVVSDHGYSTITEAINVESLLRGAGFPSVEQPGGVAVAGNGGSALFYTHHQDPDVAGSLSQFLMEQPWCGPVVASDAVGEIPGTLPAFLVGDQGPRAPEITMSFQWNSRPNRVGYGGHVYSTGGRAGQGQHGSMSRHELRNVLFGWGPSFKRRSTVLAPSGNIDLAPTVLRILGMDHQVPMDGRVLEEALVGGPRVDRVDWSGEIYNAERRSSQQVYRQQIKVSLVGDTVYVDEGSSTLGRR
ncbi:MAG TPA: alkaline phosphatase family protein [Dehalococcoidia bacterium]|nr:alkaline phosphatase family protein [Dehalococcoidia bacterium]